MEDVIYLEGQDFTPDGRVVSDGRPSIIMLYADYCGHCKSAKPQFQQIAGMAPNLRACAIHGADGDASDKAAEAAMRGILPAFKGYPTFILMDGNGKFVTTYEGERTAPAIIDFCSKNL